MYTKIYKACTWWNKLDLSSGRGFSWTVQQQISLMEFNLELQLLRQNNWQSTFKTSTYTSNASKFWSQLIESSNIYQNSNLLVACETTHCLTARKNTPRSVLGTKGRLLWHWSQSHVFWGDFRRDRFWLKHFQLNLAFLQFSKRILSVSVVDTLLGTNVFLPTKAQHQKGFPFPKVEYGFVLRRVYFLFVMFAVADPP